MAPDPSPELTTFELFVKLPVELRVMIWGFVALFDFPSPRAVEIFYDSEKNRPYSPVPLKPPRLLFVNQESRVETRKAFEHLYPVPKDPEHKPKAGPNFYVRPKVDIIYFSVPPRSSPYLNTRLRYLRALVAGMNIDVRHNLKNLTIDLTAYIDWGFDQSHWENILALLHFRSLEKISIVAGKNIKEGARGTLQIDEFIPIRRLKFVEEHRTDNTTREDEGGREVEFRCVCCDRVHSLCRFYPHVQDELVQDMEWLSIQNDEDIKQEEAKSQEELEEKSRQSECLREQSRIKYGKAEEVSSTGKITKKRPFDDISLTTEKRKEFEKSWVRPCIEGVGAILGRPVNTTCIENQGSSRQVQKEPE